MQKEVDPATSTRKKNNSSLLFLKSDLFTGICIATEIKNIQLFFQYSCMIPVLHSQFNI